MAAMSTYSGSWSFSRFNVPWKRMIKSKNSHWNPTVRGGRLRSLLVALRTLYPTDAQPVPSYRLTMGCIFHSVAQRPTEEILRLKTESKVE